MYTEEELAEMRSRELTTKKQFVEELGQTISHYRMGVSKLDYDVFADQHGYIYEYLVITYRGGAIAARNCNHNSLSAIFDEVSRLLNGGYYEEVAKYKTLKSTAELIAGLSCE